VSVERSTTAAAAAVGAGGESELGLQQQQQGQGLVLGPAGGGSLSCDAATDHMTQQLSVLTVVENDDYSRDYDIVVRECLKQGLYPTAADAGNKAGDCVLVAV
jgi:hypothetical protein